MPKGIIETLEMVQVNEQQRQRLILADGTMQLAVEAFLHEPPVKEAGQRIADRLVAKSFAKTQAGQGQRDLSRHGGGQALLQVLPSFRTSPGCRVGGVAVFKMQET